MASRRKISQLAHQLFRLSVEDGQISSDRVSGVLEWVEKHRPPNASALLRAYKHLVAGELARSRAVVEFAGAIDPAAFTKIGEAMSKRYGRPIETVPVARPELISGVRVSVGCDIYENSVLSQLASLNAEA